MSLRYQINVRVFLSALCILILGSFLTVWQARDAVNKEVESSINLAVQLVELSLSQNKSHKQQALNWLPQLAILKATRHLNIQLKQATGNITQLTQVPHKVVDSELPPEWFINGVGRSYPKVEYPLVNFDGSQLLLIIQANPLDEITEVWQESLIFFSSLLGFTLLTFIAVNLTFQQSLISINKIVAGLRILEVGRYDYKLPKFKVREYSDIAVAINQMSSKLQLAQSENSELTRHSLQVQEEQRQHLSQELHDELGQSLTAIKVMAVTAGNPKSNTLKITTSIVEICDHLMQVVRGMMYQLHPLVLTELGLKATLDDMLMHWHVRNPDLEISLQCDECVATLPAATSIQVFRIIQECLTNIVRHANADKVDINLNIKGQQLFLSIKDNGQGCDFQQVKTGFGLRGMQERVNSLGGTMQLESPEGKGVLVTVIILAI
jgi:two-component system sensor histidine kinase UhpB